MSDMQLIAHAKINLTLEVLRRLPSGYHEIRTVFQQVDFGDELILADGADGIHLTCDDARLPVGPDNLVWRAGDLVRRRFGAQRGVRIHLRKRIPIGGGLAGGSSDAAATLLGLNTLWQLGLTQDVLLHLGAELGSDVPFCILGGTAVGAGRGEELTPLPNPPRMAVVIAHPGTSLSTKEAYAGLRPEQMSAGERTEDMAAAIRGRRRRDIAAGLHNVFENNAIARLPAIGHIKALMLESGAWNACLSGSGSCVFGLVGSARQAETIAEAVSRHYPHVFVTRTM